MIATIGLRFYPEALPAYPNEPTRERFSIERIGETVGEGVVALVPFAQGEIVCGFTGFLTNEITQFSLQLTPGLHVHDPYFMGKILHHCDPNTTVDMVRRVFIARRDIFPGELVTMDYAETEDFLFRTFPCACGAANCRGYIKGRMQ